jgi:hypothetical protein
MLVVGNHGYGAIKRYMHYLCALFSPVSHIALSGTLASLKQPFAPRLNRKK